MSQAIYNDFVNAGAIHILAVSGLHVGIVLYLLTFLLMPLNRFKHGKMIRATIILILLWCFAIIAGLSPSVTRAVTMFSIIAIAMNIKRPTNIYNTLAISAFFLLLFRPAFLFEVGFQLSYVAVLAIVIIRPLIYELWQPKWKVVNYLWQIFAVTVAAQIGVAPLAIFYFNQFPMLFFISNMAIIPFLGLILGFGIGVIGLALLNILPSFLAEFYGGVISLMNAVVAWVSQQERFLVENISLNLGQTLSTYMLMIAVLVWIKKPHFKKLAFTIVAVLLVQGLFVLQKYENRNSAFLIFHKSRKTMIGQKQGSTLLVSHNLDSASFSKDRVISNFCVGNFIESTHLDSLKSVYSFKNKTLLIIDSIGVYNVKQFKPHYILLRNSPRLNLERMLDSINPKQIIADGSNYKSYIKRWEATCLKRNISFHQTGTMGAFVIE